MDLLTWLSASKTITELAASAKTLIGKGDTSGADKAIGELSHIIFVMMNDAGTIIEENRQLKEAASRRELMDELRGMFEFNGLYFLPTPHKGYHRAYYCTVCFNSENLMIPIAVPAFGSFWKCSKCGGTFEVNGHPHNRSHPKG